MICKYFLTFYRLPFHLGDCFLCNTEALFFYIIPKFIRKKHIKNTCQTLSSQILLLNENAKLRNDTNQLIQKLQQIANTTPELILKILRYYSTQSATNQQQSIFSLPQQAGIILDCLNKKSLKKIFKHMSKNEINLFQQLKLSLGTICTFSSRGFGQPTHSLVYLYIEVKKMHVYICIHIYI